MSGLLRGYLRVRSTSILRRPTRLFESDLVLDVRLGKPRLNRLADKSSNSNRPLRFSFGTDRILIFSFRFRQIANYSSIRCPASTPFAMCLLSHRRPGSNIARLEIGAMNAIKRIRQLFERNNIRRGVSTHGKLKLESLDDRIVPASITLNAGVITISGSNQADVAKVELEVHDPETPLDDRYRVSLSNPNGSTTVWFDLFKPGSMPIYKVNFYGFAGDDQFFNLTSLKSYARGHSGADILVGGDKDDVLYGDGDNDMVYGNGGNDTLHGDSGPVIVPTALIALFGAEGDDFLEGGYGNDSLFGEGKSDFLWGGEETDFLYGGSGPDTIYGNDGNDYAYGQNGDDYISGDDGVDYLYGGNNNDQLYGGNEGDFIFGGYGNDSIGGDDGNDMLNGNAGKDSIYGHDGADSIYGGTENDDLHGGTGNDLVFGQGGNDTIYGDDGADYLNGGLGDDYLNGGIQNLGVNDSDFDTLIGSTGSDYFRFEEVDGLSIAEYLASDFINGIDKKP